ncbi:hypothetical protein I7X12_05615 [Halosimplex litoreum]|uniref:Uncharacterized protein n=1 Tax=Halosimplex litoreum TaxID=1198301 RepID=A0A7T3G1A0_9EURY|nr:hypothetical protein [Halosimplex litoreum]QPV64103.1 hypothetical protein I7X12_05615 [Halosimplex litoreum]
MVGGVLGGIERGSVAPVNEKASHELDERTEKPLGEYASIGGAVEFVKESPEVVSNTVSDALGSGEADDADVSRAGEKGPEGIGEIDDEAENFSLGDVEKMDSGEWMELDRERKHELIDTLSANDELDKALYGKLGDLDRNDVGDESGPEEHLKSGAKSGGISGIVKAGAESIKDDPVRALSSGVKKGGTDAAAEAAVEHVWDKKDGEEHVGEAVDWASERKKHIEESYLDSAEGGGEETKSGADDNDENISKPPNPHGEEHENTDLETEDDG